MNPTLRPLGDSAITIALSASTDRATTRLTRETAEMIRAAGISNVEEVTAAYSAVTVFYDSLHASFDEMSSGILAALTRGLPRGAVPAKPRTHSIPVKYDGPDLQSVADSTGLSVSDVIGVHSAAVYEVDLLGFVPGFAYLSELDARLELPRRSQPRPRVPAGSVAIAARLTGIYPFETPGGWHILGNTSAVMFDPRRSQPSLFSPGDLVKFEPLE